MSSVSNAWGNVEDAAWRRTLDDPEAWERERAPRMSPEAEAELYPLALEMAERNERQDGDLHAAVIAEDLYPEEWRGIIGIQTGDGHVVKNVKPHFFDQAAARSVSPSEAVDALSNYMHIGPVQYNEREEPSVQYVGRGATVVLNPGTDTLVTTWRTGERVRRKYGGTQ